MNHGEIYKINKAHYILITSPVNSNQTSISLNGGSKYSCRPEQPYKDICKEDTKGKYKSYISCSNDCESKYIDQRLGNIRNESKKFYFFIKDIVENEHLDVYIKGGNALGLNVLKMIRDKFRNNDKKFEEVFNEFLDLELIKDWDFVAYSKQKITKHYRNNLDSVAKKYNLVPRAKTFILYQTKHPLLIDEKVLFEIAVLDSDNYSKLELPLTTMKIRINRYNKYIYMFAKSFFSYQQSQDLFDLDIIKKMLDTISIKVHYHKDGLYDPRDKFDPGNLNQSLIEFIDAFAKGDKKITQFLATHIEDPFRLFYRLLEKNIPKTEKIKLFAKKYLNIFPSWLMDVDKIKTVVNDFCVALGEKIVNVYDNVDLMQISSDSTDVEFSDSSLDNNFLSPSIKNVMRFLSGVNFGRTQIEYNNFTDNGKECVKTMFAPLLKKIKLDELQNADKLIVFLKFLKLRNIDK